MERDIDVKVSTKEDKLLQLIRSIEHGEMRVIIQDSEPSRVEKITESLRL